MNDHHVLRARGFAASVDGPAGTGRLLHTLLFVSAFALWPSLAAAQCKQWDVSGEWKVQQSDGYTVTLNLRQSGTEFTGTASHDVGYKPDGTGAGAHVSSPVMRNASVEGNVQGTDFYMSITWGSQKDTHGIYRGKITAQGRLEGRMYHKQVPKNKASWFSSRAMKCVDAAANAPAPTPTPLDTRAPKRTGKAPVTPTPPTFTGDAEQKKRLMADPMAQVNSEAQRREKAAAQAAEQAAKEKAAQVAGISANPSVVETDGGEGETTLTWNAGASHPNAEVWVQVNDREQKLIFTGSKGSQIVTVKRGRTYRYFLRDGRQRLGIVTVQAR